MLVAATVLVALVMFGLAASGTASALMKPVIGAPSTTPAQPFAGKRFAVQFRVTRSDTGASLTRGVMVCDPSVAGKTIAHAESFRRGTARLAFVVPTTAAGRMLKVKVTIKASGQSATRVAAFKVQSSVVPSLSVASASVVEGNTGETPLAFAVTLSSPAAQIVSVDYATVDGTAVTPADYAGKRGVLTFARGETSKAIVVNVSGDVVIEPDETFTVTLSRAVNATISVGTATGTITTDDTAAPVTPGSYKGSTQNGNYVFFTVAGDRTVTNFRINDIPCSCDGPLHLTGGENFGSSTFTINSDGSFTAKGSWTGSNVQGDAEWLHWDANLTGQFTSAATVTGTIVENYELKYKGRLYRCTTGTISWSATLQG